VDTTKEMNCTACTRLEPRGQ